VITFDNLPPPTQNTLLSTEYQAQGIVFGANPAAGSGAVSAIIDNVGTGEAHSGSQVASIEQARCQHPEGRQNEAWGRFTQMRHHVQLFASDLNAVASTLRIEGWVPELTSTLTNPW